MGAMLTQELDGTEQVISTFSQKFNDAQLKYTVGKQELLAAHEACDSSTISSLVVTYSFDATTRISPASTQSTPISVSYVNNSPLIRTMEQNSHTLQVNSVPEQMDSVAYRCLMTYLPI
jgi:hypothetical protein